MPSIQSLMGAPRSAVGVGDAAAKLRLLGLLPLGFFLAHGLYYWKHVGLGNMLWMCTLANLMLAAGLLIGYAWLIRLAVIWLIPGLPLWLFYLAQDGEWLVTSFFTHVGGLIVGLVVLSVVRFDRRTSMHAFLWYLFLQQISRMVTAPALNVNVAHNVYQGWETVFSAYWQYWLATTALAAIGLWVLGLVLLKLFPPVRKTLSDNQRSDGNG